MILVVVLVLTTPLIKADSSHSRNYYAETDYCTRFRSRNNEDNEVYCEKTLENQTKVTINIKQDIFEMKCSNSDKIDYSKIPQPELPNIDAYDNIWLSFKIDTCSLPSGTFAQILSQEGIHKLLSLELINSNYTNLSGSHFTGLNNFTNDLDINNCSLHDVPSDLFEDLKDLKFLKLKFNRIHLPKNIFAPLTKLTYLELSDNEMINLPDGIFSNNNRLKTLHLENNNLEIQSSTFKGLHAIVELNLSENAITSIPEGTFQHLKTLQEVILSRNELKEIPGILVKYNKELRTFELIRNKINLIEIPVRFLSNLKRLSVVKLSENGIATLPGDMFLNSSAITNVILSHNNIEHIPELIFNGQENILKLNLSSNKIKFLHKKVFENLRNLRHLDIAENQIENLSWQTFAGVSRLKTLNMKSNKLKKIDAFVTLYNLRSIDMSSNRLFWSQNEISPFSRLIYLKRLNLSSNNIMYICEDWTRRLPDLENLDLSFNVISEFHNISENLFNKTKDFVIDLRHNRIQKVTFREEYQKALAKNVKIIMEKNKLICDCNILSFFKYLNRPSSDNSIIKFELGNETCEFPKNFADKKIINLDPGELFCLVHLGGSCTSSFYTHRLARVLDCKNSTIDVIQERENLKKYKFNHTEIHLENNNLDNLRRIRRIYENVTKLYLNGSNLTEISLGDISSKIEVLDLRNNNLVHLAEPAASMIVKGSRLQELWISGNPIACDCDNMQFLTLLSSHQNKVKDYDLMRCPDGQMIKYLDVNNICGKIPIVIAACLTTAIASLIGGLIATAYYKYNRKIKVYLFAKGWCLWWVAEEELDKDKLYDAFISYSYKDEDFVINDIISPLEKEPQPFKLCVHFRDWIAGEIIPAQIEKSVRDSRRTIVVLSPHFLDSIWGRMEFRTAHSQALKEGRARVIVIIYGDIGEIKNLEPELQSYLSTNTYLKWGDPWFWDKLRYALPHPTQCVKRDVTSKGSISRKKGFVDRLEMTNPASLTTPLILSTPPAHQDNLLLNEASDDVPSLNGQVSVAITVHALEDNANTEINEV